MEVGRLLNCGVSNVISAARRKVSGNERRARPGTPQTPQEIACAARRVQPGASLYRWHDAKRNYRRSRGVDHKERVVSADAGNSARPLRPGISLWSLWSGWSLRPGWTAGTNRARRPLRPGITFVALVSFHALNACREVDNRDSRELRVDLVIHTCGRGRLAGHLSGSNGASCRECDLHTEAVSRREALACSEVADIDLVRIGAEVDDEVRGIEG